MVLTRTETKHFRASPQLSAEIEEAAFQNYVSTSELIRRACRGYIEDLIEKGSYNRPRALRKGVLHDNIK